TEPVPHIVDGDALNGENFREEMQAVANRTRWLRNRIDGPEARPKTHLFVSGSGSVAIPEWAQLVEIVAVGGGGGGGGGSTGGQFGAPGGGSGGYRHALLAASLFSADLDYSVGTGGE